MDIDSAKGGDSATVVQRRCRKRQRTLNRPLNKSSTFRGLGEGMYSEPFKPGSVMHFALIAFNKHGPSGQSLPITVRTLREDEEGEDDGMDGHSGHGHSGNGGGRRTIRRMKTDVGGELTADLPPGWSELWDPETNDTYYYNEATGENQVR